MFLYNEKMFLYKKMLYQLKDNIIILNFLKLKYSFLYCF